MDEGYMLMGFGIKYIDECVKMVETLKMFDNKRPVALLTHEIDRIYIENNINIFNDIIYIDVNDIKDENTHNSFCVKPRIHMSKYMPYNKIIALDSDIICLYNPQNAWDFFNNTNEPFMCSGYNYEECWHWGKVNNIIKILGKQIPSIHGGVLYFNKKNQYFDTFYKYCIDALHNYDNYGCVRLFRGGMTDEVIFSIAMAKLNILPLHYINFPIVSFNLPNTINLPCYIHSREGENYNTHIKTNSPIIFNHLFFHETSCSEERKNKLELWYNDLHNNITLTNKMISITALYDISRPDRDFSFYLNYIKDLLKFKLPLVIFCNNITYQNLKIIERPYYTRFIIKEIEDLEFYRKYYKDIYKNINNINFINTVKEYGRIETINSNYNIIQYSKFYFIEEVKKIINSKYYIWLDAGVSRFFDKIPERIFPNYEKLSNKIIIQTFKESEIKEKFNCNFKEALDKINLFDECTNSRYLIIGTTIIVPKDYVEKLKNNIIIQFNKMLEIGFLNNEQVAIEFCVKENPEMFDIKINKSDNWYNMFEYI